MTIYLVVPPASSPIYSLVSYVIIYILLSPLLTVPPTLSISITPSLVITIFPPMPSITTPLPPSSSTTFA